MAYAGLVVRKQEKSLMRYAYTDGTTFFLARGPEEKTSKQRGKLGRYVWRMSSGADALYDDNVAPCLYAKAQGLPVKIWGFLANGRLEYWVLPVHPNDSQKTTSMNGDRYGQLILTKFAAWRRACFGGDETCHLIQDHERCLWRQDNVQALRRAGCVLEEEFPKTSPDLNAIEGAWRLVKERLEHTEPVETEGRGDFLVRLRRCVHWINEHRHHQLLCMCTNLKERAQMVLELEGAKTKW